MSSQLIEKIKGPAETARDLLSNFGAPVMDLVVRLWIARVFFNSGMTKINDFENTVFLFEFEYNVPVLSPEMAAYFATAFELAMPVLLVIGLFTRLSAVPLLVMSMVIQFVLGAASPAYDNVEHYYWMILLLVIIARGPGPLSLDNFVSKKLFGSK